MHAFEKKNERWAILNPPFVHVLVDQVADENPDQIAVASGNHAVTCSQLISRADVLAQVVLQTDFDAKLIGIGTSRSLDMVIGVLAILKAGKPTYRSIRLTAPNAFGKSLLIRACVPVL